MIILSSVIICIGWFVTGYLNRRANVAQKRLEYRLKVLEKFWPIAIGLATNKKPEGPFTSEFSHQFSNLHLDFLLYGEKEEVDLMSRLVEIMKQKEKQEERREFAEGLTNLANLVRHNIRKELKFHSRCVLRVLRFYRKFCPEKIEEIFK
jgi:hypothetical protein